MKRLHHLIIPFIILVTLLGVSPAQPAGAAGNYSLRFYGNGSDGIDRVRIPIDPHVPANVGGDFTIEFWMKAAAADNTSGTCTPGGVNWINGNVIIDRDVYGDGDHGDYGISLYGGKIAFGVARGSNSQTICSSASVADNVWHHIAVTRNATSGAMRIFVDGVLSASGTGPTGDVSYRAGRSTSYPDSDPYLVFGAEKHDAGPGYPSYNGYLDEVRISNNVRYTVDFYRPAAPLTADGNTVALYRFDEGPAGNCEGAIGDVLGTSNGSCEFGGSPAGPVYSADTPPIYQPDLIITGYQLLNEAKTEVITEVGPNQGFWIRFQIRNRGGGASGLFYPGVFLDGKPNYGPDHEVFGRVTSFSDFRISPPGTLRFQEGCLYYDPDGTIDPLTQLISTERGNYTRSSYNSELAPGATANVDVYIGYPASELEYSGSEYDNIRTGLPPGNYNIHLYVDPDCSGGEVESNEYNNHFGPITLNIGTQIDVTIGGELQGSYHLSSGQERREYYNVSGGPVTVQSLGELPIVSAIRLQSFANNTLHSFVETMGVPQGLLSHKYVFPTYNNTWSPLNSQVRFGNLNAATTRIRVTIGGVNVWEQDVPGLEERRLTFPVSGGPVVVESLDTSKKIVAAIRLQSFANNTLHSFSETMGIPNEYISHKYYFPTYNNTWAPLNSQVRFGNLSATTTRIRVTIGGTVVWEDDVPGLEERRLTFPVSGGPVVVESLDSSKKIVAAIRLQSYANNTLHSFVETMGVPDGLLSHKYYFPTYNNTWAPLNSQVRFGNLSATTTRIRVTIGGTVVWEQDVPGLEERRLYFPVSGGPVIIESLDSSKKIVAAIRLQSFANNILYSFSETMGIPAAFLSNMYYFPTYNNTWPPLNSQLRFGVP